MTTLFPLMLVPLLVWIAVWGYLWTLDNKAKRLQNELARLEQRDNENCENEL